MYLASEYQDKYPDFYRWLKTEFPKVTDKSDVMRSFNKHCRSFLMPSPVWGAPYMFRYGFPPEVRPDKLSPGFDAITTPGGSLIVMAEDLCALAKDPWWAWMLEATLMHEFVHYVAAHTGGDVFDETQPYAFEDAAYGHTMSRTWIIKMRKTVYGTPGWYKALSEAPHQTE